MVTVICEKTGIEFEAKTARTKNHPAIMSLLNEAAKDGWYTKAMRVLSDGKELQLQSIEEFVTLMEQARDQADVEYHQYTARKRAEKEARRERYITNARLREHGYTWSNLGFADEEEADAFNINAPIGNDWYLFASNGHEVTVQQALAEIEGK